MKIGILIDDFGVENKNFKDIEKGNPGVGGTVYEEILLAKELSKQDSNDVHVYVTNTNNSYFNGVTVHQISKIINAPIHASKDQIDILVFAASKPLALYKNIEKTNIKYIVWAHVFLNYYELKKIRSLNQIKRVVFVGKVQYQSYIADDIIKKATYIYNMFNADYSKKRHKYGHNVCYLGALNRYKGFHILAEAWPQVVKKIPDATLYVVGRGNLYDNKKKLGKYKISDAKYEKKFIKYITDSNGEIIPSIKFLGNLGKDKDNLISKMAVGVVNPSGQTETFCISAVEINACGVPVCTTGKYGLLDTVKDHENGLYSFNSNQLADNIVRLLEDENLNKIMGQNALKNAERFNPPKIVRDWIDTLENVYNNIPVDSSNIIIEPHGKIDLLKNKLYRLRIQKGYKRIPSFVRFEYLFQGMARVYFRDEIYHILKK